MILKFRAYDKTDKKMYLVDEINFNRGEFESIGDGITFLRRADKVELMQSTGLEDANGNEIFEAVKNIKTHHNSIYKKLFSSGDIDLNNIKTKKT